MSGPGGSGDRSLIRSVQQLVDLHARGEKSVEQFRVGTEYERFGVTDDGRPLTYAGRPGKPGIVDLFSHFAEQGWEPLEDGPHIVGLKSAGSSLALEPGGQLEWSGAAHKTIMEAEAEIQDWEAKLVAVSRELGIRWMWTGLTPVHDFDELDFIPKRRYGIMRRYLPTRGSLALWMMQKTGTVQANLDYADEADMGAKLRLSMGLGSIVTAMFANSPLSVGKKSGYKSFRGHIWTDTDNDRSGLLRWAFEGLPTYRQYVEYALDVPMFFFVRDDQYVDCAGLPFRQFMDQGFDGHQATVEDWELHLSTIFPDARLKTYLEVRTADCVRPEHILALPALWKGLLYNGTALDSAWDLVKGWSWDERQQHRIDVARYGLQAHAPSRSSKGAWETTEVAKELLAIARYGLTELSKEEGHECEGCYLVGLSKLTESGRSPADVVLEWFGHSKTRAEIIDHYTAEWPTVPCHGDKDAGVGDLDLLAALG